MAVGLSVRVLMSVLVQGCVCAWVCVRACARAHVHVSVCTCIHCFQLLLWLLPSLREDPRSLP